MTKKDDSRSKSPPRALVHSVSRISHDLLTLAQLQGRLLSVELRDLMKGGILVLVVWFSVSIASAIACVTTGLFALTYGLNAAGLPLWQAALISSAFGFLLSGIATLIGWKAMGARSSALANTVSEFNKNVDSIKTFVARQLG